MRNTASTKCFIDEYLNGDGRRSARLREKGTARKVDLGLTKEGLQPFLQFLSAARANKDTIPDVYSRDGEEDFVLISGDVDFDAPDEIRYIYNENLSYSFG